MRRAIVLLFVFCGSAALANSPPPNGGTITTGWVFARVELFGAAAIVFFSVFVTAAAYFLRKGAGFSEEAVIRLVSLILIVSGTLFLVTLGYSAQQIAPALGILGTIAGYMLGRSRKDDAEPGQSPPPTQDAVQPAAKPAAAAQRGTGG